MTNGSTARRLVVAALALGCVSLAVLWPTWRTALAQLGGYPDVDSSFLGCVNKAGGMRVVLAEGDDVTSVISLGSSCADALNNSALSTCEIATETQSADQGFATLYRITC